MAADGAGNEHTSFLRCLAHRLTVVKSVHRMWRTEGASPALYFLAQLEEAGVAVDVLRTVHAASLAVVPVDASQGFPLCLPAYPFSESTEGVVSEASTASPGVAWVEHHTACLVQLLGSKFAECVAPMLPMVMHAAKHPCPTLHSHVIVGLMGCAVLSRRLLPLLRAHSTTPLTEHDTPGFAQVTSQASFVLQHLQLLAGVVASVGKCSEAGFTRRLKEATSALDGALGTTTVIPGGNSNRVLSAKLLKPLISRALSIVRRLPSQSRKYEVHIVKYDTSCSTCVMAWSQSRCRILCHKFTALFVQA